MKNVNLSQNQIIFRIFFLIIIASFGVFNESLFAQQPCADEPVIWVFDEDQATANYHLWSFKDYNNAAGSSTDYGRARYFDPVTNVITPFPTSGAPGDIESMAVDPTTGIAYFTTAGRIAGGPSGTQSLWALDLDTVNPANGIVFKLVGHIDAMGDGASENLAYYNGKLYFAQSMGSSTNTDTNTDGLSFITIAALNPNPMLATTATPIGLLQGLGEFVYYLDGFEILPNGTAYAVDGFDDELYQINLSTGAIIMVSDNNMNGGISGTVDIETIAWDPINSKLIGTDNAGMRFVDVTPGVNGGNVVTSIIVPGTPGLPSNADFEGSALYAMCSQINVCSRIIDTLCSDGSQSITFTAQTGLTNVVWKDSTSNSTIGTGNTLIINGTEPFLADGYEAIYYTATDANGCPGELCCKVYVATKDCTFFDLALRKKLSNLTPGPFNPGSTVSFEITVFNQGTKVANNIQVTDYTPVGLTLSDAAWSGTPATLVTSIPTIAIGDSVKRTITYTIANNFQGSSIRNWAEISSASGGTDIDSDPDGINFNQSGETNDLNDDNVVNQNGKTGGDEDDHDPAQINVVQTFDLALKKIINPSTPGPYTPGSTVTFTIKVYNQGTLDATNVNVTDYVPSGLTLLNPGTVWTAVASGKTQLVAPISSILKGDSTSIDISFMINTGYTGAIRNWSEVSAGTNALSYPDIDSDLDNINFNEIGETNDLNDDNVINENGHNGEDEDDHDPAEIFVGIFDLALRKTTNQVLPVKAGDHVIYRIKVFNQGTFAVNNVQVCDTINSAYLFINGDNPGWTNIRSNVVCYTLTGSAAPAPGDSTEITLDLIVKSGVRNYNTLVNEAEVSSFTDATGGPATDKDSYPDSNFNNDNPVTPGSSDDNVINEDAKANIGDDEDDNDVATVPIFDLALKKTVGAGPFVYGQLIPFTIKIYNQGNQVARNITITDYIPSGFMFSAAGNAGWSGGGSLVSYLYGGPLNPNDSATITINLTLQSAGSTMDNYINYAEISQAYDGSFNNVTNYDYDSQPDQTNGNDVGGVKETASDNHIDDDGLDTDANGIQDEDDHDPAYVHVWDLALRKTLATAGPYTYGQDIQFDITVFNQGTDAAQNITVRDYIPSGYTFIAANNPLWSNTAPNVNQTIAGPLAPGASTTIQLILRVNSTMGGSRNWINYSEIVASQNLAGTDKTNDDADSQAGSNGANENAIVPGGSGDDDILSTSNTGIGSQDDHDPAGIPVYDLALRKTKTNNGPYSYGQLIPFTIKLFNQGNIASQNIRVVDYIPAGFTFNAGSNPGWTGGVGTAEYLYTNVLNPGDSVSLTINLTVSQVTSGDFLTAWTNYAEIKSSQNTSGGDMTTADIDSDADGTNVNDPGGQPGSAADNYVNGDGTGVNGDGIASTDEDDHDPERIRLWDLALRKTTVTGGPYTYGQTISYKIAVFNQGNDTARNVVVRDYIPEGYSYVAASNPGWTGTYPTVNYTIAGPIVPGDSASVTINLLLINSNGGAKDWVNYSEIISSQDMQGTNRTNDDADSQAGSNGANENAILPDGPGDNDILSTSNAGIGSQDDHDPAGIPVYDLALRKTKANNGPYSYGQLIPFTIKLFNQGNIAAQNIRVVDYIPTGFTFNTGSNAGWTGGVGTAEYLYTNVLNPGDSVSLTINLTVSQVTSGDFLTAWTNYAEIKSSQNTSGGDMTTADIDSDADGTNVNDPGGQPGSAADNYVNGDGTGVNGDGIASTDEDDHDPERIRLWDLALRKTLVTGGPYTYGQTISYKIAVFNQGNDTARNVVVRDYIPEGYSYVAGSNPGWTGTYPTVNYTITGPIVPGDSASVTINLLLINSNGGAKDWVNYSEIISSQDMQGTNRTNDDADSQAGSNGANENAILPDGPGDNDILSTSNAGIGSQDDHDPAGIPVYDLALRKVPGNTGPYTYGQVIPFNIWVFNQGNINADEIQIVDYVPQGFDFDNLLNSPMWNYNPVSRKASTTITSVLAAGDSTMLTIYVKIVPTTGGRLNWVNYAEIYGSQDDKGNNMTNGDIDSKPNTNPNDDPGGQPLTPDDDNINGNSLVGGDEDDHDPALIEIIDLALRKTLTTSKPYSYGQIHNFRIAVFNQGNEYMQNVEVSDYIPTGYTFIAPMNPSWTLAGTTAKTIISGPLAPGDSAIVNLQLRLDMTIGGTKMWVNYSEITAMSDTSGTDRTDDDIDSNPGSNNPTENGVNPGGPNDDNITSTDKGGEEDDHDPAGPQIFDLALTKKPVTPAPYYYGTLVQYRVEVTNQGNIPANAIAAIDYIPCGLEYVAGPPNTGWIYDPITNTVSGNLGFTLAPGASITKDVYLRVKPCYTGEANAWTNYAEIKTASDPDGNPFTDIDSNPNTNPNDDPGGKPNTPDDDNTSGDGKAGEDEDDHDPAIIQIVDLALRKQLLTPAPYRYGDVLDFEITVKNQGNVPMDRVEVKDYIPTGYAYSASLNPSWTGAYPTISQWINQRLYPGDSVKVPLKLTIIMTPGSEKAYINYAEITETFDTFDIDRKLEDADSRPGSDGIGERAVEPGSPADDNITSINKGGEEDDHDPAGIEVFDLAQKKWTNQTGPFRYNDLVTFNIRLYNQGSIAANTINVVDYIPCGYAFLSSNNPTWTYDAISGKASTTYAGPLVPGDSATITIVLQVQPCSTSTHAWTNYSEITSAKDPNGNPGNDIDSNPNSNPNDDPGGKPDTSDDDKINGDGSKGEDEDDHDPARIEVYDLALRKFLQTAEPYNYGQSLTFGIVVYNQGNVPAQNVQVKDYIPSGFSYSLNNSWVGSAPVITNTVIPRINPEDSAVLWLYLTLNRVTSSTNKTWINYAEILTGPDTLNVPRVDADSDPNSNTPNENGVMPYNPGDDDVKSTSDGGVGSQDDHDPAGPRVFDMALRKTYSGSLPIKYGQVVPFRIAVFNQGNQTLVNPSIVDYIPSGYTFVPASNANWTYDGVTRKATTTISATVQPGDSAWVTLNLRVEAIIGDTKAWYNLAEITEVKDTSNNPIRDIDSNPDPDPNNDGTPKDDKIDDPTDEDDHDPAEPPVVDFALRKWVPNEKLYYLPGDTVDFIISLHNQGNVTSSQVGIRDYIPHGYNFLPLVNPGWSVVGANLEYNNTIRLNPGDSIQIPLKLKVVIPASNVSLYSWENYAEIRNVRDTFGVSRSTDDADSNPLSDSPWERNVHDGDPWDNVIDGNGQGVNEDEDDHDPEKVTVTAYLGDKVWKDLNGNGIQDAGEPGIANVIVNLYDCATGALVKRDTTDSNGIYGFEALFGDKDYFVRFDAAPINMPNCAWTFPNRGVNDKLDSDVNPSGITDCIHLDWGERDSTVDAGLVELATYGDYVWHDRDVDGQQESGEEGVQGVTVVLYDAATNLPVRTAITDNNGYYLFDKLMPMQYYAKYTHPSGWAATDPNIGSDITDSDVDGSNGPQSNATTYLSPGEIDRTWDYGIYKCSCISGEVWFDLNKDGIYQSLENGINGLNVYLVDSITGLTVAKTVTGTKPGTPSDDGYYSFCSCLKPGTYYIRYDRPGELAASAPFQGSDRTKDSHVTHAFGPNTSHKITVTSGSNIENIHAGFQIKAVVGNFVWLDSNQNGLQDAGEQPVKDVKVGAYNMNNVMVSESLTGVDGKYTLDGIAAGDYYVKFTPTSQYAFTTANSGNDDIDSDVTGTQGYGTTQVMRINTGDVIPHVDAGLVVSLLPLEWLSFTGEYNGSFTELNWKTGVEVNNSHFEIERKYESEKDFRKIGTEQASANATAALHEYGYDDFEVNESGVYYYRIKQVDRDGKYTYSRVIAIKKLKTNDFSVYVYPNPVRDLLKIEISIGSDETVEADVIDQNGKVIMVNPFGNKVKAGKTVQELNTEILPGGTYVLRIKSALGTVNKKLTVAR